MPARGRHQSTSKECRKRIQQIEALDDVIGVIIGHSYGGKSLGKQSRTGAVRVQRVESGGLKAVTNPPRASRNCSSAPPPGKPKRSPGKSKNLAS